MFIFDYSNLGLTEEKSLKNYKEIIKKMSLNMLPLNQGEKAYI
jgi:hypothetical protein